MKTKTLLLFILSLHLLISFNLKAFQSSCSPEEKNLIKQTKKFFSQRSIPTVKKIKLIHQKKHYEKHLYTLAVSNRAGKQTLNFYYYKSLKKSPEKKPLVLIFSGIGGITVLERYISYYLTKKGISTLVYSLNSLNSLGKIESIRPYFASKIFSGLSLLDFAASQPDINPQKIATIGVSLGGYQALYLTALDLRVKSGVLVVSGASLPKAMAYTSLPEIKKLREKHMKALGLDPKNKAKYIKTIEKQLPFKVETITCRRNYKEYYLFQSQKDTVVPFFLQKELSKILGYPKTKISRHVGHKGAAVFFGLTGLRSTVNFLRSNWKETIDFISDKDAIDPIYSGIGDFDFKG